MLKTSSLCFIPFSLGIFFALHRALGLCSRFPHGGEESGQYSPPVHIPSLCIPVRNLVRGALREVHDTTQYELYTASLLFVNHFFQIKAYFSNLFLRPHAKRPNRMPRQVKSHSRSDRARSFLLNARFRGDMLRDWLGRGILFGQNRGTPPRTAEKCPRSALS